MGGVNGDNPMKSLTAMAKEGFVWQLTTLSFTAGD